MQSAPPLSSSPPLSHSSSLHTSPDGSWDQGPDNLKELQDMPQSLPLQEVFKLAKPRLACPVLLSTQCCLRSSLWTLSHQEALYGFLGFTLKMYETKSCVFSLPAYHPVVSHQHRNLQILQNILMVVLGNECHGLDFMDKQADLCHICLRHWCDFRSWAQYSNVNVYVISV